MTDNFKLLAIVFVVIATVRFTALADERSDTTASPNQKTQSELVETWFYEKAKGITAGKNHAVGSGHVWTGEQTTTEPFEKIWAFYSKRCGHEKPYDEKQLYRTDGTTKDGQYAVHDSKFPVRRTHSVFTYDCPDHSVSVLVFRGKGDESPTRIFFTWIFRKP